jgi:hypothetical protein
MLVVVSKEDTIAFLERQIEMWRGVCPKPNFRAFEFDPKTVNPEVLAEAGYYDDRVSWIAGVAMVALGDQIKTIKESQVIMSDPRKI